MRSRGVTARVPGKVNLQLSVGPLGDDGYHEVTTVFQAISLFDDVSISTGESGSGIKLSITGQTSSGVPVDNSNLAVKAAELMVKKYELSNDLVIKLKKEIPVAGGMAGGSADAAGVIVCLDSLFDLGLSRDVMESIGSQIGADVPFSISGGVAIGTGRGDQITPALYKGNYNWVLALSGQGLSTPSVYQECDRLREGLSIAAPVVSEQLMQGTASRLLEVLNNQSSMTIIMVNHQLDFLEEFAERVIYLEAGKIRSDCLANQLDWLGLKTQLIDLEKSRQSDHW